ncbi:hypothetical protein [Bifidobacterium bombi]|nr:hypothetical protein [Bifidobacterium bombi]
MNDRKQQPGLMRTSGGRMSSRALVPVPLPHTDGPVVSRFPPKPVPARKGFNAAVGAGNSSVRDGIPGNVVVVQCASGGVGLTTLCALLSLELTGRGCSCVLVDADFQKGGLDVLLGMENDQGLRFGSLDIPLGNVSGMALYRQLPQWEGVRVLAFDPWDGDAPQPWLVEAVIRALAAVVDVVVVDAAYGSVLADAPALYQAPRVVLVELSVLGTIRSQALLRTAYGAAGGAGSHGHEGHASAQSGVDAPGGGLVGVGYGPMEVPAHTPHHMAIVGMRPRGAPGRRGVLKQEEASLYLGREFVGTLHADAKLAGDVLEGLGIRNVPKTLRPAVGAVVDDIERWLRGGDVL